MRRERWFRRLMVFLFAVSALVSVAQTCAYHLTVSDYKKTVEEADRVFDRARYARRLTQYLAEAESGQRGYLLTGNPAYRAPYAQALEQIESTLTNLRLRQPPERSGDIAQIEAAIAVKRDDLQLTLDRYDREGPEAALQRIRTDQGRLAMEGIKATLERLIAEDLAQLNQLRARVEQKNTAIARDWNYLTGSLLFGLIAGAVALWRTSRRIGDMAEVLEYEARHDSLTGLPNRSFFLETLRYLLALARRERQVILLAFLDLDGFKAINDHLGHEIGDLALIDVATALRRALRESDVAARLGGDEFVVILPATSDGSAVCARIEAAIRAITRPEFGPWRLETSIGLAAFPVVGETGEALFSAADARMFANKRQRKSERAAEARS